MNTTIASLALVSIALAGVSCQSRASSSALSGEPATVADVGLRVETRMDPPRWATLERQLLADNVPACREFFKKYFDDRGYLQCFVRWGANDGPDDAFENFNRWPELHALGAGDEILQMFVKRPRGADQAVHRGQDHRRADRAAGHVLQGIHRPVRLDAPRRRAAALQPHGPVDPGGCEIPGTRPAVRRVLHGRGSRGAELRPGPQDHPQHAERQPRADAPKGHGARLGRRPVRRQGIRCPARRIDVRAVPGPLRGIQRRRRRPLSQSGRHDAADERVSSGRRAQVQEVAGRVHGRLARSDEAATAASSPASSIWTAGSAAPRANGGTTPTAGDSARSIR